MAAQYTASYAWMVRFFIGFIIILIVLLLLQLLGLVVDLKSMTMVTLLLSGLGSFFLFMGVMLWMFRHTFFDNTSLVNDEAVFQSKVKAIPVKND